MMINQPFFTGAHHSALRFFKVDQEFLDSEQASGSTATMCVVKKPEAPAGKHQLLVINAGDSRVLLGKRDGTIVDGGGTDKGHGSGLKCDLLWGCLLGKKRRFAVCFTNA